MHEGIEKELRARGPREQTAPSSRLVLVSTQKRRAIRHFSPEAHKLLVELVFILKILQTGQISTTKRN